MGDSSSQTPLKCSSFRQKNSYNGFPNSRHSTTVDRRKKGGRKGVRSQKRKNRRLKQSKEEAQAEIEKYKAEREAAFKNHEAKYAGSKGDVAARIDQDAKSRIDAMNQSVNANKAKVISGLIDAVCNIEPKVHVNYRT